MPRLAEYDSPSVTEELALALDAETPPQASSQRGVLVFIVSLVLFGGGLAMLQDGDWEWIVALIGVIAVHELGHLAAMRAFGFSDLNMFFIPFFGAAATGRKFDASATQRAIVSLAGPVPGILLGLLLAFVVRSEEPLVWTTINLLIIVNLFNLLPTKPLDGGRFLDVVLFRRWPAVQSAVALLSAVALGALAYSLSSWLIGVLAAFALISNAGQAGSNRAAELIRAGLGAERVTSETIPPHHRELVLRAVAVTWGTGVLAKTDSAARLMKRAWLQAAIEPSPLAATAALLGVYLGFCGLGVWLLTLG